MLMRGFILLVGAILLPYLLLAQLPAFEPNPFQLKSTEIKAKGLRSIKCTSFPKYAYSDNYSIEESTYDREGNLLEHYLDEYGEFGLQSGEHESYQRSFQDGQVLEERLEQYTYAGIMGETYEYKDSLLVEKRRESYGYKPLKTMYEYRPDGQTSKIIWVSRYAKVEEFIYDDQDRLVGKRYFWDEDDEEPYTTTEYRYDDQGMLREELEIEVETGDTSTWKKYEGEDRLIFLQDYRTNYNTLNYSGQERYLHQEYRSYDDEGKVTEARVTIPELIDVVDIADSIRFGKIKYYYEDGLISKIDSIHLSFQYNRNDQGQTEQIVSTLIQTGDTFYVEHFEYDEDQLLSSIFRWDYQELRHNKWVIENENGKRVKMVQLLFSIRNRCKTQYDYFPYYTKATQYCDINPRSLPSYVPGEIMEYYFNGDRDTIKISRQYGNHDRTIIQGQIDTFIYQDRRLLSKLNSGKSQGYIVTDEEQHIYDEAGLLQKVYQIWQVEQSIDTSSTAKLFYTDGVLTKMEYWKRDHKIYDIEYGPNQRIENKIKYNPTNGEKTSHRDYQYNDQGELISIKSLIANDYGDQRELFRYEYEYY